VGTCLNLRENAGLPVARLIERRHGGRSLMTTETRFLGLGAMGSALAQTALESGRPIVVWNRTPERTAGWAERGATVARSLTEAVSGDGVIVVCLLDHASVRQVLTPVVDALAGRTVVN